MAQIIELRRHRAIRRRERQQDTAVRCMEIVEYSLRHHVDALARAPQDEWPVRATKIRRLGELLEYTTHLVAARTPGEARPTPRT